MTRKQFIALCTQQESTWLAAVVESGPTEYMPRRYITMVRLVLRRRARRV